MEFLDAVFAGPWGPVVIFFMRIIDVSLSTVRWLLTVRDARRSVPIIAFFECLVWIFAAGSAITNLKSSWHLMGYTLGFAAGTWVGMWLEEKLAFGFSTVSVISRSAGDRLAARLRDYGFGVTEFEGRGRDGSVTSVTTVVRRKELGEVLREIRALDQDAFVTVAETRAISRGWLFPLRSK